VSNSLALATMTATVARLVGAALEQVPNPSAIPRVRFGAPQLEPQFVGCTIFASRIGFIDRPHAALEVDYLLTFAGEEATLEPQRFLGSVVTALHAQPVLAADVIRQTITANAFLEGSDLGVQVDLVRLTPRNVDLQTLGQLVNVFPHMPYNIWVVYTASAIVPS
jgi:hypothetical protein